MSNPFTLSFGKKPLQYISRISQTNQILETFRSDVPSTQIFMITGVRGSGKTVMMTSIANELRQDDSWIVIRTESRQRSAAKSGCQDLWSARMCIPGF